MGSKNKILKENTNGLSFSVNWELNTVKKFRNDLDWNEISKSTEIEFDSIFLTEFKAELNWKSISENASIKWTLPLIEEFKKYLDWSIFCKNVRIENPLHSFYNEMTHVYYDFLHFFNKYIDWNALCQNQNLWWGVMHTKMTWDSWSYVDEKNQLDYPDDYTRPHGQTLINYFKDKWVLSEILINDSIDKRNWIEIFDEFDMIKELSGAKNLSLNQFIIANYQDKWDFKSLTRNSSIQWTYPYRVPRNNELDWTITLIDKYIERWDWDYLSSRENLKGYRNDYRHLFWTKDFIIKYKDYWNWENLIKNISIPWTENLLEELDEHLPESLWRGTKIGALKVKYIPAPMTLCGHIPISGKILSKYAKYWRSGYIDGNDRVTDDPGDWIVFARNHNITLSAYKEFKDKIPFEKFINGKTISSFEELKEYMKVCDNERDIKLLYESNGVAQIIGLEYLKSIKSY